MTPSGNSQSFARPRDLARKVWHDPVGSKVVAAMITGAIASVAATIWNCREAIAGLLRATHAFLVEMSAVPNWLLILLAANAMVTTTLLVIRWWWRQPGPRLQRPEWFCYVSDCFLGVNWRWQYNDANHIVGLRSYCPRCNLEVSGAVDLNGTQFICAGCRFRGNAERVRHDYAAVVKRMIQRKIENGQWRATSELLVG